MWFYSVYGFRLQADRIIPGLTPCTPGEASGAPSVQVWLASLPEWFHEAAKPECHLWRTSFWRDERGESALTTWKLDGGAYFWLRYSDGTEFIVDRPGTRIWATWPATLTLEDAATYLLGPVIGFVLLLRGVVCLHASAIAVGDKAIALLGPAGAGKSTTAASFARLGYPVLAEDVAALSDQGTKFLIQPGYPLIRLWPESVHALCGAPDALPLLTPNWDKRYLDLAEVNQFHQRPLPLAAVYILDERRDDPAAPFVEPVPAGAGLIALVANTYVTYMKDSSMRGQEFDVLGRVAANVPLRKVTPHTDIAYLPALCDTILRDFRALQSPGKPTNVQGHIYDALTPS